MGKIQALVASDLSTFVGEFMLSPTTLLRAMQQWEELNMLEISGTPLTRKKEDIMKCLASTFTTPFFRSSKAELEVQVAYQTRFSMDLLYREGLLGADGDTRGLANFVTHLFEIEPANLVLAKLLSRGLLHRYLEKEAKSESKGDRRSHLVIKLLSVLCWLFYRKRLPGTLPTQRPRRKKHLPSTSCPELPPLPEDIAKEIEEFNVDIVEHVLQLAYTVASTRKIGEVDMALPLSEKTFRSGWDPRAPSDSG